MVCPVLARRGPVSPNGRKGKKMARVPLTDHESFILGQALEVHPKALHPDTDEQRATCQRLAGRGLLDPEPAHDKPEQGEESGLTTVYVASEKLRLKVQSLTEAELAVVTTALERHPKTFAATPEGLAICEGLVERGSLERITAESGVRYRASDELIEEMEHRVQAEQN